MPVRDRVGSWEELVKLKRGAVSNEVDGVGEFLWLPLLVDESEDVLDRFGRVVITGSALCRQLAGLRGLES